MTHNMSIGWIGLGNMGTPMAKNILTAGFPLMVYNRTIHKTAMLKEAGAAVAQQPLDLMNHCDVIITMLSNDDAVRSIYEREEGLYAKSQKNKITIDMSTVSPALSRELNAKAESIGIHHLDAPVAGSVKPATEGQLVIMAGGNREAFEKVKPIFNCLGKVAYYLGNSGAGNTAKLAINLLLGFNIQGLSESVMFAEQNGIDASVMTSIINASACSNGITQMKTNNILQHTFQPAFSLKLLSKDLRLASASGLATPLGKQLHHSFQEAESNGYGDLDCIGIIEYLRSLPQK
jgi:3-hydroxyisobutyrate dehydrogenase